MKVTSPSEIRIFHNRENPPMPSIITAFAHRKINEVLGYSRVGNFEDTSELVKSGVWHRVVSVLRTNAWRLAPWSWMNRASPDKFRVCLGAQLAPGKSGVSNE